MVWCCSGWSMLLGTTGEDLGPETQGPSIFCLVLEIMAKSSTFGHVEAGRVAGRDLLILTEACKARKLRVLIVSGDKDPLQLLADPKGIHGLMSSFLALGRRASSGQSLQVGPGGSAWEQHTLVRAAGM